MTTIYTATVTAYLPIGKDRVVIEVDAPANTTIKIKKIRITYGDGTGLVVNDASKKIMMHTESVAGVGGNSFTPIPIDANAPPAQSIVKTGSMYPGTLALTIDVNSVHSGTDFLWQAADEDDKIVITPGSIFAIMETCSG